MNKKQKKGISLIVLVITIIVIIILAGSVILSLSNNNPIENASKASYLSDVSNFKTELDLYKSGQFLVNTGTYDTTSLQANSASITYKGVLDITKTINDLIPTLGRTSKYNGQFEIQNGELAFKGSDSKQREWVPESGIYLINIVSTDNKTFSGATTGFSYNNPVIPAGFVAVNTADANWSNLSTDYDNGLVIKDSSGNEFVWVPVDGTTVTYAKWCTTGIGYNDSNISDDTTPTGFNATNITTTYKGFYIARYEAMFDYNSGSIRAASKKSLNATTSSWIRDSSHTGYLFNFVNYANSKTYAENMATSYGYDLTKVGTNLITGAQWDTTMKWIQNSTKSVTDSRAWGNYNNSISPANVENGILQISGYNDNWKAKNIYDLAGNTWEWTNEKYSTYFMGRGGNYNYVGSTYPAAFRTNYNASCSFNLLTFRTTLYIL